MLVSLVPLVVVEMEFTWWGVAAAALWVPASLCSIVAVKTIGLGVGQGLWSGITIIVSFFWGAFFFGDRVASWILAIVALVIALSGIFLMATSNTAITRKLNDMIMDLFPHKIKERQQLLTINQSRESAGLTAGSDREDAEDPDAILVEYANQSGGINSSSTKEGGGGLLLSSSMSLSSSSSSSPWATVLKSLVGLGAVTLLGLLNGSMMVPSRLSPLTGFSYIPSFGIGVGVVTTIFTILYSLGFYVLRHAWPQPQFKKAILPCAGCGTFWAIANMFSVFASAPPLGLTIGFPLCQTSLVVAGLWSLLAFREIKGLWPIGQFVVSTVVVVVGSMLLSIFG